MQENIFKKMRSCIKYQGNKLWEKVKWNDEGTTKTQRTNGSQERLVSLTIRN